MLRFVILATLTGLASPALAELEEHLSGCAYIPGTNISDCYHREDGRTIRALCHGVKQAIHCNFSEGATHLGTRSTYRNGMTFTCLPHQEGGDCVLSYPDGREQRQMCRSIIAQSYCRPYHPG